MKYDNSLPQLWWIPMTNCMYIIYPDGKNDYCNGPDDLGPWKIPYAAFKHSEVASGDFFEFVGYL